MKVENFGGHPQDIRSQIYEVYLSIFKLQYKTQRKCSIMTPLLGGDEWSWRVTGISEEALRLLAENDYKYKKGIICRAHIFNRIDTAKIAFDVPKPLTELEFFSLYWKNDRTVITTKAENKTNGRLPLVIPIEHTLNHFPCGAVVGWKHRKQEANFLRELHKSFLSGYVVLADPYLLN